MGFKVQLRLNSKGSASAHFTPPPIECFCELIGV